MAYSYSALDIGTGEERTLKSDGNGGFNFSNLQVGHYAITITRDGFSPIKISDVELQLAQRFTINPVLHVGAVNDKVTVVATDTPLLNPTSSSVGQVINTDTVQNMPLNGRNFWQLTQLAPGVSYIQGGQNIQTGGTSIRASAVNVNVNGLSPSWTGWYLDDANITEFQLGGTIIQPNVDALQEFKVESGNMGADYGHSPTIINATLQRQFVSRVSLDMAYVGNKTTHMVQPRMINAPQPGAGAIQTRRPRPQWGTVNNATYVWWRELQISAIQAGGAESSRRYSARGLYLWQVPDGWNLRKPGARG
jgi:hypothetical protein